MNRLLRIVGALLVVSGLGTLGYVGYSYAQQQNAPSSPHWSASQQRQGREIARTIARRQKVTVPKRLQQGRPIVPGSEPALRMIIPRIGVNAPVAQSMPVNGIWDVVDWQVGHLATTPNPGASGNGAYSAHDDIKGEIFKRVGELRPGDVIKLRTAHAVYAYAVTGQLVVDPSDVSVLAQTRQPTITLVSCTPYWVDTQRLIIHAMLRSERAL